MATVTDDMIPAGTQRFDFDGSDLAAGVYLYEVITRTLAAQHDLMRQARTMAY